MIRRFFCALAALILTLSPAGAEKIPPAAAGAETVCLSAGALRAATEDAFPAPGELPLTPAAAQLVRLHIVADDDTQEAQALKLKVRDRVLEEARQLLGGCTGADEAYGILTGHLPGLEAAALDCARAEGFSGAVTAQTGVFAFPDRDYGGVKVPAGNYRALRVVLGDGEGRTWGCGLYPTLCMPQEEEFHSILAQWFERWFGGMDS